MFSRMYISIMMAFPILLVKTMEEEVEVGEMLPPSFWVSKEFKVSTRNLTIAILRK